MHHSCIDVTHAYTYVCVHKCYTCARVCVCHAALLERMHRFAWVAICFYPGKELHSQAQADCGYLCQQSYFTMAKFSSRDGKQAKPHLLISLNDLWEAWLMPQGIGQNHEIQSWATPCLDQAVSCSLGTTNLIPSVEPWYITSSIVSRHQCCSKCVSLCAWNPFNTDMSLFSSFSILVFALPAALLTPEGTHNIYIYIHVWTTGNRHQPAAKKDKIAVAPLGWARASKTAKRQGNHPLLRNFAVSTRQFDLTSAKIPDMQKYSVIFLNWMKLDQDVRIRLGRPAETFQVRACVGITLHQCAGNCYIWWAGQLRLYVTCWHMFVLVRC